MTFTAMAIHHFLSMFTGNNTAVTESNIRAYLDTALLLEGESFLRELQEEAAAGLPGNTASSFGLTAAEAELIRGVIAAYPIR